MTKPLMSKLCLYIKRVPNGLGVDCFGFVGLRLHLKLKVGRNQFARQVASADHCRCER
jgi:hypothetical protein